MFLVTLNQILKKVDVLLSNDDDDVYDDDGDDNGDV